MVASPTVPRLPRQKMTGEVLDDRRRNGKQRPWKQHKQETLEISDAYLLLGDDRRSVLMSDCGSCRALLTASQVRLVGHRVFASFSLPSRCLTFWVNASATQ
jgi:hypothetical protein